MSNVNPTIPEKIERILGDCFNQLNSSKRAYLIAGEADNISTKERYELEFLKSLLNLELSIRKIQSLNTAAVMQQDNKQD